MPQTAFSDSEALDEFATRLQNFKSAVQDEHSRLSASLWRLGESWTDEGHERFRESMDVTLRSLEEFWTEIDRVVPQLRQDAENIRRFDQHNL